MYSISDKKIYNLVGLIYETAKDFSSQAWLDVYQQMSTLLSSGAGSLSLYSPKSNRFDFVATNLDSDLIEEYNNQYQHISPFRKKIVQMNAGETFSRAKQMADKEFLKTQIYQEYFKKQDVFNYEYQTLFKDKNVSGGVSFSRPESMKNFGKNELKVMQMLAPHLQRAFQIYVKFSEVERDKQIMIGCLEKIPQSVIVLDKSGRVVFSNENANKFVVEKDGLELGRNGVLLANLPHESKKLQILLQSVFEPNINSSVNFGGVLQISRASGLRPLSLLVSPFSEQQCANSQSEKFALLFVNDPEQKVETVEPILREMYGLTAAESKITAILAQGTSVIEACELLKIKPNTIRTHLKRIFSKTETNRQSELMKLILNSPATLKSNNVKKI